MASEVVSYPECAEWLQDRYPDATIRTWSTGDLTLAINRSDMGDVGESEVLRPEALPGDWTIESVVWSRYGLSLDLTRAINLPAEDDA